MLFKHLVEMMAKLIVYILIFTSCSVYAQVVEAEKLLPDSVFNKILLDRIEKLENECLKIENILIENNMLDSVSFCYMGKEVKYGVIRYAGLVWMDRNIGAKRVAKTSTDIDSFGDYFQWGREADGHQEIISSTTSDLADSLCQAYHSKFIISTATKDLDWNKDKTWRNRWQNSYGFKTKTDVCPDGWHIPTLSDWNSLKMNIKNKGDAFRSPLKIPSAGFRSNNGVLIYNNVGHYWSSSPSKKLDITEGVTILFSNSTTIIEDSAPILGLPIRCVKD